MFYKLHNLLEKKIDHLRITGSIYIFLSFAFTQSLVATSSYSYAGEHASPPYYTNSFKAKALYHTNLSIYKKLLFSYDTLIEKTTTDKIIAPTPLPNDTTQVRNIFQEKASTRGSQNIITYQAEDSIIANYTTQRTIMYQQATIKHLTSELTAYYVALDWKEEYVRAMGRKKEDTVTQTTLTEGKPLFTDKGEKYEAAAITYLMPTQKVLVEGILTKQDETYMYGEDANVLHEKNVYIGNGKFTTCDLETPHFRVKAKKIKFVGNKIVTSPFQVYVREIPLPIGFFFGIFPKFDRRGSGVIIPSYGEERNRGFFLRGGGYYFAINDYMDLSVTTDLYSKGSYGGNTQYNYKKRYKFQGNASLSYNNNILNEDGLRSRDFWFTWTHAPQGQSVGGQLRASVNFGTSSYNNNNLRNVDNLLNNTQSEFNSNISYNSKISKRFSQSINLRHNQNVERKIVRLTFPDYTFRMNRLFPFRNINMTNKIGEVLKKVNLTYLLSLRNEITNVKTSTTTISSVNAPDISPFTLQNLPTFFKEGRHGVRHNLPVSVSYNLLKYMNFTTNFNYTELWYAKSLRHAYNEGTQTVETDTLNSFSRAGYYNVSQGASTTLYNVAYLNGKKIKAIRHVIIPNVSFSYTPDFSDEKYGIYQKIEAPNLTNATSTTLYRSKFDGFIYGTAPRGRNSSLSFSLSNQIEAKVRNKADTLEIQKPYKNISLIENISASASYNLAADSFALSTINLSTRFALFKKKLNINISGNIDPYVWESTYQENNSLNTDPPSRLALGQHRRIDVLAWQAGQGIGRLQTWNMSANFNLQSKSNPAEHLKDYQLPWNMSVAYNRTFRQVNLLETSTVQSVYVSGSLKPTKNTSINFSTGYDFNTKEFNQMNIGFTRSLHCWELNGRWIPFGRYTSYEVRLFARANVLKDVKIRKQRSFYDNIF